MATYYPDINQTERPWGTANRMYVLENTFEIDDLLITGLVQNSVVEALAIPAKTIVLVAGLNVIEAATTGDDVDLGVTGGTADGFVDGANCTSTGLKVDLDEGYNTAVMGLYFSSADTIDIKVTGAATLLHGKIKVWALCIDLSEL